jgi:hypothetical protein
MRRLLCSYNCAEPRANGDAFVRTDTGSNDGSSDQRAHQHERANQRATTTANARVQRASRPASLRAVCVDRCVPERPAPVLPRHVRGLHVVTNAAELRSNDSAANRCADGVDGRSNHDDPQHVNGYNNDHTTCAQL